MTNKVKADLLKIGWYQIIGGAVGVFLILYLLLISGQFSGLVILLYALMLLFFGYSVYCGILCIKSRNDALTHSLINQFLQVLGFAVFGFAFSYVSGLFVSVGLDLSTSIELKFNLGISKFDFKFNREVERIEVSFNLVAFGLIYWIDRLMKAVKAEKEETGVVTP
jgi:hypothetical protein